MKRLDRTKIYGSVAREYFDKDSRPLRRSLVIGNSPLSGKTAMALLDKEGKMVEADKTSEEWEEHASPEIAALWLSHAKLYKPDGQCTGKKRGDELVIAIQGRWLVKGKAVAAKILTLEDGRHGVAKDEEDDEEEEDWDFTEL